MARIIVTTDPIADHAAPVLMDESIYSIHLDNDHNAAQLIERLGWAIDRCSEHPAGRTGVVAEIQQASQARRCDTTLEPRGVRDRAAERAPCA